MNLKRQNRAIARFRLLRTLIKRHISYNELDWYDITEWPTYILEIWNCGIANWHYSDRLKLILFFHGNGLSWYELERFIHNHAIYYLDKNSKTNFNKSYIDVIIKRMNKLEKIWEYIEEKTKSEPFRFYYYNISLKHMIYYNNIYKKDPNF